MRTLVLALIVTGAGGPTDGVRLADRNHADAVRRALAGAAMRMNTPGCQRLLDDFRDRAGRPLRHTLDRLGLAPSEFLTGMLYYDGDRSPTCRDRQGVVAFTAAESRVVFVCGARFLGDWRRSPPSGEITLIHEALHALGLGENPPSSHAITRQVDWSCPRGPEPGRVRAPSPGGSREARTAALPER